MPRKRQPKKERRQASFYHFDFPESFIEGADPLTFRGPPIPTSILIAKFLGIHNISKAKMKRLREIVKFFILNRDVELKRPRIADVRKVLSNLDKAARSFLGQSKTINFFKQLDELDQRSIDALTSTERRLFGFFDSYRLIFSLPAVIHRALNHAIPALIYPEGNSKVGPPKLELVLYLPIDKGGPTTFRVSLRKFITDLYKFYRSNSQNDAVVKSFESWLSGDTFVLFLAFVQTIVRLLLQPMMLRELCLNRTEEEALYYDDLTELLKTESYLLAQVQKAIPYTTQSHLKRSKPKAMKKNKG